MLQLHWVKYGFGTPKQTVMFYVWKIFFYALFGLIFCGAFTKGLEFNNIAGWWDEPILYQKLMIWTILLEIIGLAATCGPLAFHFDPPIGGDPVLVAERHAAGPAVPEPRPVHQGQPAHAVGHRPLQAHRVLAGHDDVPVGRARSPGCPTGSAGVMPQWALVTYCCLIVLMGLRDKIVFLSARSEQYVPTMLYFGLFDNFHDMIVGAKIASS